MLGSIHIYIMVMVMLVIHIINGRLLPYALRPTV